MDLALQISAEVSWHEATGNIKLWTKGLQAVPGVSPLLKTDVRISPIPQGGNPPFILHLVSATASLEFIARKGDLQIDTTTRVLLLGSVGTIVSPSSQHGGTVAFEIVFPVSQFELVALDRHMDPRFGFQAALTLHIALEAVRLGGPSAGTRVATHGETGTVLPDHWRDLAVVLGLDERRVFEIRAGSFRTLDDFKHAADALQNAKKLMFDGHYPKAIAECRNIVEGVLERLDYAGNGTFWYDRMKNAGLPAAWVDLIKAFKNIVNPEHHRNDYDWSRVETEFMITTAASLAQYLANMPGYKKSP